MKLKVLNYLATISLLFTLNSCLNQYEKEAIGNYELYKYELRNSKFLPDEFTKLDIKSNKTFEIKYENKIIKGEWKADDNGDWTYIELVFNKQKIEGRILGNSILFEGQKFKEFEKYKSMEFARIEETTKFKTEEMIKELSRKEFEKTFSNKMIDVTKTAEPILNIWEYAKVLSNQQLIPSIVYDKELVEFVYRNNENTFEHILLPTSEKNVFVIIVVNIIEKKIKGHYKIDIEKEYGLK